jgi:hypothetical protein
MEPRFLWLATLFDAALWLALVGAVFMLRGLLIPGWHWGYISSGGTTIGLSLTAGTLTVLLALWG